MNQRELTMTEAEALVWNYPCFWIRIVQYDTLYPMVAFICAN